MRVLWIVNVELPDVARQRNVQVVIEGWLHQLSHQLKNTNDIEFSVACLSDVSYFNKIINGEVNIAIHT